MGVLIIEEFHYAGPCWEEPLMCVDVRACTCMCILCTCTLCVCMWCIYCVLYYVLLYCRNMTIARLHWLRYLLSKMRARKSGKTFWHLTSYWVRKVQWKKTWMEFEDIFYICVSDLWWRADSVILLSFNFFHCLDEKRKARSPKCKQHHESMKGCQTVANQKCFLEITGSSKSNVYSWLFRSNVTSRDLSKVAIHYLHHAWFLCISAKIRWFYLQKESCS